VTRAEVNQALAVDELHTWESLTLRLDVEVATPALADAVESGHAAVWVATRCKMTRWRMFADEAADEGVWRFLAVVVRPQFVRHRWENPTFALARSRFWGFGTRPDSNTFSRLWWIAELTREGRDYSLTERVLAHQSLANLIFTRSFCEHRPCVEACVEVFEPLTPEAMERAARDLHHGLSTRVLETLTTADVVELATGS